MCPGRSRTGSSSSRERPHTYPPLTIFSEAPTPSQLFDYFLLDTTGFEPNVFTTIIPGINDGVAPTATGANHDTPTIGAVRLALEPKPGLPTDPNDPGAFIDIFTDISGALRHQQRVGLVRGLDDPRPRRAADVGPLRGRRPRAVRDDDAGRRDRARGAGRRQQRPGPRLHASTAMPPRLPSASDHFPDVQTNVVPLQLSHGRVQLPAAERLPLVLGVQRVHGLGLPALRAAVHRRLRRRVRAGPARVPVVGRSRLRSVRHRTDRTGLHRRHTTRGSSATTRTIRAIPTAARRQPRAIPTVRWCSNDEHKEKRLRFIPSGLANEILLDVYVRVASFEPGVTDFRSASSTPTRRRSRASTRRRQRRRHPDRGRGRPRGRLRRRPVERSALPPGDAVQPLRRDARDQRRPAGAALRAEPARLGAERHVHARVAVRRRVGHAGRRQPVSTQPFGGGGRRQGGPGGRPRAGHRPRGRPRCSPVNADRYVSPRPARWYSSTTETCCWLHAGCTDQVRRGSRFARTDRHC